MPSDTQEVYLREDNTIIATEITKAVETLKFGRRRQILKFGRRLHIVMEPELRY